MDTKERKRNMERGVQKPPKTTTTSSTSIYNKLCTLNLIHGCLDPAIGEKQWSIDHGETTTTHIHDTDIYTRNNNIHRRIDMETAETHWIVDLDRPSYKDSEQIDGHLITSNRPHLEAIKIQAT